MGVEAEDGEDRGEVQGRGAGAATTLAVCGSGR